MTPSPVAAFIVRHFSDTVEYTCNGFLEKNRDTISKELVNVLRQSDLDVCRLLMALDDKVDAKQKRTALDGRVVISASKQLVTLCFAIYCRLRKSEIYPRSQTAGKSFVFSFLFFFSPFSAERSRTEKS